MSESEGSIEPIPGAEAEGARDVAPRLLFVQKLEPSRGLAYVAVILVLTLFVCFRAFGFDALGLSYGWWVAGASFAPFLVIALGCTAPRAPGRVVTALSIALLIAGAAWYIASSEVYRAQSRALSLADLELWWSEPGRREIVTGFLLRGPLLALAVAITVLFLVFNRLFAKLSKQTAMLVLTGILAGLVIPSVVGNPYEAWQYTNPEKAGDDPPAPSLAEQYAAQASAPWSLVHDPWDELERPFDPEAAKAMSNRVAPPTWAPGPVEQLAELRGLYSGRSIVVILMESQRASNTGVLGEGAFANTPVTPRFDALSKEGLLFTRYYASGLPTDSALWSISTGLPEGPAPGGMFAAPKAARVGRLPRFQELGYRLEWIRAAHPSCQNWSQFLSEIGIKYWIDPSETEGLDRTWWNVWGMPDDQLLEIGYRRLTKSLAAHQPFFLLALTSSNHEPFRFPNDAEGKAFGTDFLAGMRFADDRMATFVQRLRALPEADRPIVFITADTSSFYGLEDHPLKAWAMEATQIPGLLILPDGKLAGERHDGIFVHDDLTDLLLLLVAPKERPLSSKFEAAHRVAAIARSPGLVVTEKSYYFMPKKRAFELVDRWKLIPTNAPSDPKLIFEVQSLAVEMLRTVWKGDD